MKKTQSVLLLCALLCLSSPSHSQTSGDYQFHFQFENTLQRWVPAPDGHWFGVGWSVSYPGFPVGVPFIIKWNPQTDNIVWTKEVPMPWAEFIFDVALLLLPDGGAYFGAVYDGCDYGTSDGLARLDADGNILWTVTTPWDGSYGERLWLIPYPNGNVLFQTNTYQIEYDGEGNMKWHDSGWFDWNGVAPRQNGGYLVYGNKKYGLTNLFLNTIYQSFPEEIVYACQLPSGNWLFLGYENLYRVSPNFAILSQQPIAGIKPWSKIVLTDAIGWLTGESIQGNSILQRIDTATLEVVATHDFGDRYQINTVIHLQGDSLVWLSGNTNFDKNQTAFLKSAPLDALAILPDHSVALTNIRLENEPKGFANSCFDPADPDKDFSISFGKVFVTVKNTGKEPVETFRVNAQFDNCITICKGFYQISNEYSAPMQPGDSLELVFEDHLYLEAQKNVSLFELCLWVSLPDGHLDSHPEDDKWCQSFSVVSSEAEPTRKAHNVRVVPNPASTEIRFYIENERDIKSPFSLSLVTPTGQVVWAEHFSTIPTHALDCSRLPAGLYFYELSDCCSRIAAGKLVITD
ncbi:MAG: T9SS type A sorting domain-containing protein [Saprospiraceae bacterium]|nr:T9SS type A sorting domain-containing protein [Saprospiraceae bacterium]